MASTSDVCKTIVEKVDDCLALGVVDLNTGSIERVQGPDPVWAYKCSFFCAS